MFKWLRVTLKGFWKSVSVRWSYGHSFDSTWQNGLRASKTQGLLDQVSPYFLWDLGGLFAVLTLASLLRSSHSLWNASVPKERACTNFRRFVQQIGYHSNVPLNDRGKKVRLIMPTHMSTYPENSVMIDPVYYDIIGLQWDRYKKKN